MEIGEDEVEHEFIDNPKLVDGTMEIHRIVTGLHQRCAMDVDAVLTAYTLSCHCSNCNQLLVNEVGQPTPCTVFARAQGYEVHEMQGSYLRKNSSCFKGPMCQVSMELQNGACRPKNVHEYFERRRSRQKRAISKGTLVAVCINEPLMNWRTGINIYVAVDKPFRLTAQYLNNNDSKMPIATRCGQYLVKALKLNLLREGERTRHPIFQPMPGLNNQEFICQEFEGHCGCLKIYHHQFVNLDSVHYIGLELVGGRTAIHGSVQGVKITDFAGDRIMEQYNKHRKQWRALESISV